MDITAAQLKYPWFALSQLIDGTMTREHVEDACKALHIKVMFLDETPYFDTQDEAFIACAELMRRLKQNVHVISSETGHYRTSSRPDFYYGKRVRNSLKKASFDVGRLFDNRAVQFPVGRS